jgi:hypothetical protein
MVQQRKAAWPVCPEGECCEGDIVIFFVRANTDRFDMLFHSYSTRRRSSSPARCPSTSSPTPSCTCLLICYTLFMADAPPQLQMQTQPLLCLHLPLVGDELGVSHLLEDHHGCAYSRTAAPIPEPDDEAAIAVDFPHWDGS